MPPVVKYPMDLSTIKARLESRFYRRVSAVQYDVRRIYINAFKFNLPTSDIVRNSSVVSDLCLEIIRNRDSNDVKALYQQVLEKYRIRDEKEEKAAGQIRNAEKGKAMDLQRPKKNKPATLATTAAPCWKQQCTDVLEIMEQSKDAELFSELSRVQDEPDYLQVMDYPMDLETVHEELRLNNYATPMEFARDVRVIFKNSKNYFTNKRSRSWCMTHRLSAVFEKHICKILASVKQPDESSDRSVSSSSKDNSKKDKSLTSSASTNESVQEVGNTRESNLIVSQHTNEERVIVEASSSTQLEDATEQIPVCNTSVIDGANDVTELEKEIPVTNFETGNLVERKTPLMSQKEQLDIDIENGYRNLETIKVDIQKDTLQLSQQQEQINAYYATLLEHDEERDGSDAKTPKVSKLTSLSALREKINGQLTNCTKQKLTQELAWREHQATALKLELQLNLLDPCENALEFRTVEKMLAEKRNHETQSEGELNLIKGEILALEEEQRDVDRQITGLKAMHDKLTEMEAMKTAIQLQILNKKSRENDLIEDLSKRINAWKTLEMKLIQILYEEAVGDIEKIAKEKFNKLTELVEGSPKR
ncbi:PH-interacting protein-like [Daphnia carinata]|uniref:PH-interacting protein-like n=1 Tax=Daphnia carinata TaxID=120202 RepID=UPI00257AC046|nr:PH-interacting protein-like [Daphnia carinata]